MRNRSFPRVLLARIGRGGFSRQGALAATRRLAPIVERSRAQQAVSLIAGAAMIGVGVGLYLNAHLGVPPYDVLVSSLARMVGIRHGQAAWILSGGLLVVASVLGRRPSLWGIGYVLATGLAVDIAVGLINAPDGMALRAAFVVAGTFSVAAGISLVLHAGTTGGAFELLMAAGSDRGANPSHVRLGLEVGVVAIGVTLGGTFGPATVFFALTIAPLLAAVSQALADHARGRRVRSDAVIPEDRPGSPATSKTLVSAGRH